MTKKKPVDEHKNLPEKPVEVSTDVSNNPVAVKKVKKKIVGKKKSSLGRPTKYKPVYAQMLLDYFNEDVVKEIKTITSGSGNKGSEWSKEEVRYEALFFPTLELFANKIDVNDDTLVEWAGKHPSDYYIKSKAGKLRYPAFSAAYTRAKRIQKGLLIQFALIGKLNPGFAQFFAINEYGMQSKAVIENHDEITHKWEDMTDEQLDTAIAARKDRTLGA